MKKRQMIKIVGPQGEDRVDTPYKCKQFNCYAQALKHPKFYGMMLIHLKLVEHGGVVAHLSSDIQIIQEGV